MKKRNGKAFTIVELVIVIAVIAILAAVLVPTFSNIIKKAQISKDTQLVRNLNSAVAIGLAQSGKTIYPTAYDAMQACLDAGYDVKDIVSTSDYDIAWFRTTGNFVLVDTENSKAVYPTSEEIAELVIDASGTDKDNRIDYFIIRSEMPDGKKNNLELGYSVFAGNGWKTKEVVLNAVGFDAGYQKDIKSISYENKGEIAKDAVIRTNTFGTRLSVNGPLDTVAHYGFAGLVEIKKIAMSTFDEFGIVGRETIEEGNLEIQEGATVYQVQQTGVGSGSTEAPQTKVSVDANATVYDINHEKIEGAVQDETVKFTSTSGTTVDTSKIGTAVGDTITASACKHENTEDVMDSQHVYEVCKTCGYTLIKVNDNKKTVATSSDANAENVIIPKAAYASSQLASGSGDANNGSNGSIVLQSDSKTETGYVEPSVEKSPVVDDDTPSNPSCQHNWQYTYFEDGKHKVTCSKCTASYTEECNTNGTDGACDKCGYKYSITVTLNKQSGEGGSDTVYAIKGKSMPAITVPTRAGYTFGGYYSSATGNGTKYYNSDGTSAKSSDLTKETTLFAYWTVNTYNIAYYDMGGEVFSGEYSCNGYSYNGSQVSGYTLPTKHTYGTKTELVGGLNPVSKIGTSNTLAENYSKKIKAFYNFAGWYLEPECSGTAITSLDEYTYTADIKLYAKWTPKVYPVVYCDKNSNSYNGSTTGLLYTHTYGTETKLPEKVEREGYAFFGWYTNSNCGSSKDPDYGKITSIGEYDDFALYNNNGDPYTDPKTIYIYAKWVPLHTVTLMNGTTKMGEVSQPEGEPMVKLTSEQIPISTQKGYTFDGYYSTKTDGGTKYYNSDGTSATNFTGYSHDPRGSENPTFYARLKPIEYTITYNLNGGSHGANYPETHTYDTATTLVSPTKDGYNFMGWYTDADFSGTALTSLSANGYTKNITLYAKWAKASAYKPLNTGGKLYYPVLGGSNPQPTKFAYSTDGEHFTDITKPDGGYKMSGDVARYAALGQLYYQGGSVTVARISANDGKDDVETICVIGDMSGYYSDIEPSINGITIGQICDSYGEDKYCCLTCKCWDEDYLVYYCCYSGEMDNSLKYVIYRTFN